MINLDDKNNFQNCPVIKTIEYFEIDKRIEERKAASDAFIAARSVKTNSPAAQVLSNSNIMNDIYFVNKHCLRLHEITVAFI